MASIVTLVTEDKEWKVDCLPLVLASDEKKASSDTEAIDSELVAYAQDPPEWWECSDCPRVDLLDTVTGEPSSMMAPASSTPKPNPDHASLAHHRADLNSFPRLVMDVVH